MMSLWDALRMNMMISYQELVRTFPLFLRYFRLHCLENSEHVSYERLICWQEMISKTQEGQSLTQNELEYLHEIVRIALYNHRLNNVSISDVKNHDTGKESGRVEPQGNDSNLLIVFYVQIMPDDFVMQLHRF